MASPAPSLTDLANLVGVNAVDNFLLDILGHLTPEVDPYMPYIPMGTWDATRGLAPTQLRATGEMPDSYPGAGTAWAQNDGSGNAHDITPTTIKFGRQRRTYALSRWAFRTEAYSVRDFPHNFQAEQFLNDNVGVLRHYQRVFIVNWKRENLVGNTDRKISVQGTGPTDYYEANNQTARFDGFDAFITASELPTSPLNWGVLDTLYAILSREGASNYAVGTDTLGNPVFPLVVGPQVHRALFRDNEAIAEPINYRGEFDMLTPYGTKKAIRGFMPVLDLEIPRFRLNYASDSFDPLFPWRNVDVASPGSGRKYERNPYYEPNTVSGGQAAYEAFYIPTRQLMRMDVMPNTNAAYSELMFRQQNFAGALQWINNRTFGGENDLGDKGYFYIENALAPLPRLTDMGFVGLGTVL